MNLKNGLKLYAVVQLMVLMCMAGMCIFTGFEYFFHVWIRVAGIATFAMLIAPAFVWLITQWMD